MSAGKEKSDPDADTQRKAEAARAPEAVAAADESRRHATLHNPDNSRVAFTRAAETLDPDDSLRGVWFICQHTGMAHLVLSDGSQHHAEPGDDLMVTLTSTAPLPDRVAADGTTSRTRVTEAMREVLSLYSSDDPQVVPDQPLDEALYEVVLATISNPIGA